MPRYAFRSWKCNKNYITLNSHILWTHAGGDDVVVVIFRCKCKWLREKGMDEATRDMPEGKFWSGSGFQQATINCNSKSLKLQQITGGKLTAKRLRCRRWRRRWRWLSSREMSTCGSRRRRQACFPQEPFESQHDTLDRSCPGQGYPFVVIFSANLLFPHFGHWLFVCVCVLYVFFVPCWVATADDVDTISCCCCCYCCFSCCCCCWVTKLGIYCKATRRVRRAAADLSLGTSFYEILFWFIYIKNYVFPLSHCSFGAHKVWYLYNAFQFWHFPQLQIG